MTKHLADDLKGSFLAGEGERYRNIVICEFWNIHFQLWHPACCCVVLSQLLPMAGTNGSKSDFLPRLAAPPPPTP